MWFQLFLTGVGCTLIFDDDGLVGVTQFVRCPAMYLTLIFQILLLWLRNYITDVGKKYVFRRKADLLDWYVEIEEKLAFEEFENINQIFSI